MQKAVKATTIISIVLIGASLTLLLVSIPFQRTIAYKLFGYSPEAMVRLRLPQFPVIPFSFCLLRAGCVALLFICCNNRKTSIWLEILIIIILAIILPSINTISSTVYSMYAGRLGVEFSQGHSVVSQISAFLLGPSGYGTALAYVTCGMSIASKTRRKQNLVQ